MIAKKNITKTDKKLIGAVALLLVVAILAGAYFIIGALSDGGDEGGEDGGFDLELMEGESYYAGIPIAYPLIESSKMKNIVINRQNGDSDLTLSFALTRLGASVYGNNFVMSYTDSEGAAQYPIMGCYGIGVGRLAAAICEVYHDDYGPIWPISIAPWQVHLCAVRSDDAEVKAYADKLYADLQAMGVEVIYDDRNISAGVMFSDADLLGVPYRVIVSPRNMKGSIVEITSRDKSFKATAALETAAEEIARIVADALAATKN